tara:strand:+ start:872 stop:2455 length:1584 start_codon:yes stop_codon:yes gene_type:complete
MSLIIENGDCLELMKSLPDNSVDLFICDLPYGETNCKWDSKIDLEQFWEQFRRLRKSKRTACIHFCSTKFGYTLIKSWEGGYKMDMVWKKRNKTGGLQSRNRPMRNHEMVYFFYDQAPKYNRDKYHKRIVAQPKIVKDDNAHCGKVPADQSFKLERLNQKTFDPKLPASVIEQKKNKTIKGKDRKAMGEQSGIYSKENQTASSFEPPNPASVVEEKYTKEHLDNNRSGAGTNNVAEIFSKENKKRYKKEHGGNFEPPNPASVVEEKDTIYSKKGWKMGEGFASKDGNKEYLKQNPGYTPRQPGSVLEEDITYDNKKYKEGCVGRQKGKGVYRIDIPHKINNYDPPNPASVVEEKDQDRILTDDNRFLSKSAYKGSVKETMKDYKNRMGSLFDPKQPTSVVEEDPRVNEKGKSAHGWDIKHMDKPRVAHFDPKLPLSVVIPAEDEPVSMFESTKVFIGKRHHQTEKPQDILEFFIKYWTDEGDTILDPTMGSGSTGVACNKLKRNFIGFELDKTIFKVAEKRVNTKVI